ncbi:MAG: 3-keto-5-aminohexanoate cleavage protein [Cytophagaceae bacterium]|nr:3-keto-5-aminohexanoate cleavage protein [Gemmatimonadaceae bacterium]
MPRPVIITCAVTGSQPSFRIHPNIPITPQQIAQASIDAARAGAAIAHIHVRHPETGDAVGNPELYQEVVERIAASGVDVVINLTTGFGARFIPGAANPRVADDASNFQGPDERTRHIVQLRPAICSYDVATFNFGETAFINTPAHLRAMAARITEAGSLPELEVFDAGHILLARQLIAEGHLQPPGHFQLCLGIKWAMPATREAMAFMLTLLPPGATWAAFGVSRAQFPMVEAAIEFGGHVRVGLEDNLYLDKGVFAPDNAALVARAAGIVERMGHRVATPDEARAILGLPRASAAIVGDDARQ